MSRIATLWSLALAGFLAVVGVGAAQQSRDAYRPLEITTPKPPVPWSPPSVRGNAYPIDLPTALKLVNAQALDIAIASQRIQQASARHEQAKYAWLPTITVGADYMRHDGKIQDVGGLVFETGKGSLYAGAGINAVITPADAIFAPLAAKQVVRARVADLDTAANNSTLAVAEAYFNLQQARGEMVGAQIAAHHAEELSRRAEKLAKGLVPPVEAIRARTEWARRKQVVHTYQERWRIASAELIRILRLDPAMLVDPVEPPHLRVELISLDHSPDTLIPIGLRNRPELASQQALVEATLRRLKQERVRPLIPSLVLRGPGTNPPAAFSGGVFGGGFDALSNYGPRGDFEVQIFWEFQNLMFGNRAKIRARQAENQIALLQMFRMQDIVAAEIAQAHAQAKSAANRLADAESGLKDAADSVDKNFQGLSQTRRAGDLIILMIRPQEVIASIQTLGQAYGDYYSAVADWNRAQFRLYRALGYPAQMILGDQAICPPSVSDMRPRP
jgi:outer membrane protein TolC